jgi:hypothetical protein
LFADNSSERRLAAPREEPAPIDLIDRYNSELVAEFLLRSEQVCCMWARTRLRSCGS